MAIFQKAFWRKIKVPDWSMEELQKWDEKICALGEALGLDWYPIEYEILIV